MRNTSRSLAVVGRLEDLLALIPRWGIFNPVWHSHP